MAKNEVAKADKNELVVAGMFFEDAGAGMEGATADSFAIPFIKVLQKGSPQVDEASGVAIAGAKAGMLYDNISGKMYDGKQGVLIVPCAYRRVFLHWSVDGFKGEIAPETVAAKRLSGEIVELDGKLYIPNADGTVNPKKNDKISDTRNHYVLLLDEESGAFKEALISLSSTQIKKSKMLMSALASIKLQGPNGLFTPPTFSNVVRATTCPENNDEGTWFGIKFELAGSVTTPDVYAAAKAFHASVSQGQVKAAAYEQQEYRKEGF